MKLVIDIGNTRTKLALFDGKEMFAGSSINKFNLKSVQEFVLNVDVRFSIISSVKLIDSETLSVAEYYNSVILSKNVAVPIKNNYTTLNTLGNDRLASVVAAHFLYPKKDVVVFDAGTCLTIDFINSKGEYNGGRISPGIEMRYKSLHTFTQRLPLVKKENNMSIHGRDTHSSIISGVQQGILAEVKSIISDVRSKNSDTIFLITGGDSFFFEKELKSSIFVNSNLVLIGLNEILDFNE